MSRCFPFPPPGYEKKARPDDVNLIIKEKHKEKKHKKDKDQKERSERKEKGRSEDKHREKKERKQKQKQKQKQKGDRKDKEKHKDKYRTSEENQNGEKPGPISELSNTIPNSRAFVELQRRVENDCEATHIQMVGEIIHSDQKSSKLLGRVEETNKREYARMVNGESLKINAMGLENGRVSIFSGENREKVEESADQVEKGKEGKEKKKHKTSNGKRDRHKNTEQDKKGKSKDKVGEKEKEKEEEKVKETSKDLSKQREINCNLLDVRNKPSDLLKERHGSQESLGKQEPELNGFSRDNGIPLNKLSSPISLSHQVIQNGISINSSQNTANLAVEKPGGFQNHAVNIKNLPSQSVGNGMKLELGQTATHFSAEQQEAIINYVVNNSLVCSHPASGISKKTEPSQTASKVEKLRLGLVNSHKAQDKVSTSLLNAESGRMEINQRNIHRAQESRGVIIKHKMDNKDSRVNGIIETEQCASSSTPSASLKVKENSVKPAHRYSKNLSQKLNSKVSQVNGIIDPKQYASSSTPSASLKVKENTLKLPHPDSKYLSQILTVPNVECPEFDDQEWLFGSEVSRAKRPKIASNQIEGTKVWAEAIPVESVDVIALPYVIPY